MIYTKEERLVIGKRIYSGEFTLDQAAAEFNICKYTARNYLREYREKNNLSPKRSNQASTKTITEAAPSSESPTGLEDYESMSKEELIKALIQSKINEARLKKGYEVKGDGSIVRYSSKNIK